MRYHVIVVEIQQYSVFINFCEIQGSHVSDYKENSIFWGVVQCSLVQMTWGHISEGKILHQLLSEMSLNLINICF
jgi:hypothetical protein